MEGILAQLRSDSSLASQQQLLVVGDALPIAADNESSFLRGHGTQKGEDGRVRATVCGVLQRVNKLLTVQPLRTCYVAQTGDIVIGRVVDLGPKKWRVDIGAGQEAALMLSAVNLPGAIQRRKTSVDELNMRALFTEGDLLTAEVQSTHQDGSVVLHTRSSKYGKLFGGQVIVAPPYLIRRLKHHFVTLPCGVHLILGCNGWVWVGSPPAQVSEMEEDNSEVAEWKGKEAELAVVPKELREKICRVAMAANALVLCGLPIEPNTLTRAYDLSRSMGRTVQEMSSEEFRLSVSQSEISARARPSVKFES